MAFLYKLVPLVGKILSLIASSIRVIASWQLVRDTAGTLRVLR